MEFVAKLEKLWEQKKFLCVGLDPVFEKLPTHLQNLPVAEAFFIFNKEIVDATVNIVCAFKPNAAFYEAHGVEGWEALHKTTQYIKKAHPEIPIILDAKRGDIGNTNNGYAISAFDYLQADAITIQPYLGKEAMKPFLDRKEKGIIVLVKTSNKGSDEFQNLTDGEFGNPFYEVVANNVVHNWNGNKNCAVVVGATYPQELERVRKIIGDMPLLIPGIGAQGGDIEKTVHAGKDSRGWGMIISSSREILYASHEKDFAEKSREKAQALSDTINSYL